MTIRKVPHRVMLVFIDERGDLSTDVDGAPVLESPAFNISCKRRFEALGLALMPSI
jgi:hypothetical protein